MLTRQSSSSVAILKRVCGVWRGEGEANVLATFVISRASAARCSTQRRREIVYLAVAISEAASPINLDLLRPTLVDATRPKFPATTAHFPSLDLDTDGKMFSFCSLGSKDEKSMALEARNAVNVNGHDDWESSVDQLLALCDGDPRAALRTLLVANEYLHSEVERLQAMVSNGYARGHSTQRARP